MEYVKDYLQSLLTDGKSERTHKSYKQDLKMFSKSFQGKTAELTIFHVRKYLNDMTAKGLSAASRSHFLAALNQYLDFCVNMELIAVNPVGKKIKAPKLHKTMPKFLTPEELQAILDHAKTLEHKAMIHTLYSTGARVSEFCALNKDDVDLDTRRVVIRHGKGDKERRVMLTETAAGLLREYWAKRGDDKQEAFLNNYGNRATSQNMQELVRNLGKAAGVKQRVHPHLFRKSVASHMVQRGIGIQIVSEYLGHSNLDTTKIYASLVDTQRAEAFDAAINANI